jgi:hypothetical protein
MDLKIYYQKIRAAEATIDGPFPIVVSAETEDGGKAGVFSEVARPVAAKMIAEGTAKLATPEETDAYHAHQAQARLEVEEAAAAARMQVKFISAAELAKMQPQGKE